MPTPIGALPDITPESAEALTLEALDDARTNYRVAQLAHRLEAADYITVDIEQGRAHLAEAFRLGASLERIYDEFSMRRIRSNVMNAIATLKEQA